jgi:hypothetical protein
MWNFGLIDYHEEIVTCIKFRDIEMLTRNRTYIDSVGLFASDVFRSKLNLRLLHVNALAGRLDFLDPGNNAGKYFSSPKYRSHDLYVSTASLPRPKHMNMRYPQIILTTPSHSASCPKVGKNSGAHSVCVSYQL